MKDTSPAIEKKFRELLMERSNEERLRMGCSMFETSKKLVEAGIRHQNPKISKKELRKQTFLRFYKNDFPPKVLQRILPKLKF